jgi:hypothetical protein
MPKKKSYSAPQLVRVELNHEQAILANCSLTATTTSGKLGNHCLGVGACKGATSGGATSTVRPS